MRRVLIGWFLCLGTGMAPVLAGDCAANAAMDSPVTVAPAGSTHVPAPPEQASAADNTAQRARPEDCLTTTQPPASASSTPAPTGSADYQPQTRFDNTPWRFDMSQNGKRMTADEFSAWMEARGVRVAKGAPGVAAPPAPAVAPEPDKK